jgi:nitric oxide reductase subunit B
MIGMVGALLVAGIAQAFYERAMGGSTLQAFMQGQTNVWFVQGIVMRAVFGLVFAAGYVVLMYDLLTIGKRRVAISSPKARVAGGRA